MRIAAALLALVLATGCSAATAAAPTTSATADAPLMVSEGGVLRPIENGSRLSLRSGYATVRLWPSPEDMDPNLQVGLFDAAGKPAVANVSVVAEMLDMDHGTETATGVLRDGLYQMHLSFGMQGRWRLVVHIARDGAEEILTLVLPWVGF